MCRSDLGKEIELEGKKITDKKGTGWNEVKGELSYISVGYGPVLWGVDFGHDVWY